MPDEPTDPAATSYDGDGAAAEPAAPPVRARRPAPAVVPRHLRPDPQPAAEAPADAPAPDSLADRLQELEARISAEPVPTPATPAPVAKAAPRKVAARKAPAAEEASPEAPAVDLTKPASPTAAAAPIEATTPEQSPESTTEATTEATTEEPTSADTPADTPADAPVGAPDETAVDAPTRALPVPAAEPAEPTIDPVEGAADGDATATPVPAAKKAKAPAKTTAAKAPAKKAAAKAPAKKAAPTKRAPAKKAAVGTAAAGAAAASAASAASADVATAAAPEQDASIDELLGTPASVAETAPEAPRARRTKVAPVAVAAEPAKASHRPASELVPAQRGAGPLWALVALLLAVAVGLGVAAIVKGQDHVWEAKSLVTLTPGSASSNNQVDALRAGQQRYLAKAANDSFTAVSALKANMPQSEIPEAVEVTARGGDQLALTARASTAKGALALANASGVTLAATVSSGEALEPNAGERLGAYVVGPSPEAVRTSPTDTEILVAGLLGGAAVLLAAGVLALVRRSNAVR